MSTTLDLWVPFKKEFEFYFKRLPDPDDPSDRMVFGIYTLGWLAGMQQQAQIDLARQERLKGDRL